MQRLKFDWKTFIEMVDNMSYENSEVQFSPLDKVLLECYFHDMNEQNILRVLKEKGSELNHYYNDCFFRWGFQPDVMKKLSKLIGKPVNKGNFKEKFRQRYVENRKRF